MIKIHHRGTEDTEKVKGLKEFLGKRQKIYPRITQITLIKEIIKR